MSAFYDGSSYLDYPAIVACCQALADDAPDWVHLEEIGRTDHGRPILLLTIGDRRSGDPNQRPAVWLDGGTHASEWAGVMGTLYALGRWIAAIESGEDHPFSEQTAYVVPCVSPDGFQQMMSGGPFVRSTLRPPRPGTVISGLEAQDIDGDGEVMWMRWFDPAGPFVEDGPAQIRHRRLTDSPDRAFFLSVEGMFVRWDGHRWVSAPLRTGLDLNRNFPGHWAPFGMFGMDGGQYPLSEPESRALMDALSARPNVGVVISNHTYTGALLTQPYRKDSPLSESDIRLMERLGEETVRGTDYVVHRVFPDFTYDENVAIVGVWADTVSVVMGLPAYTLELWNPFRWAGVAVKNAGKFFRQPDPEVVTAILRKAQEEPGGFVDWRPFDHPQLGPVELGGLRHMRTIRNPPEPLLAAECAQAFTVVERARMALPRLSVSIVQRVLGAGTVMVEAVVDNLGFLPTCGIRRGEVVSAAAPVEVWLEGAGIEIVEGLPCQSLGHLDGWGSAQVGFASMPIYPRLQVNGHRGVGRWVVRGAGPVRVGWTAGRAGVGEVAATLAATLAE
ncbi:MAG: M14 family metallopeptidase [Myxococcota bacterium]